MDRISSADAAADPPAGGRTVQASLYRHGREQQPVIVIDDFAVDPDRIVEDARQMTWEPIGPYFPGIRHPTPPAMVEQARAALTGMIQKVFETDDPLNRIESYFSLVTRSPDQLEPLQRLPHFDGLNRPCIAMVHHLSRIERGATAFFRHRSTGFESMNRERLPAYNLAVNREIMRLGMPKAQYLNGDTPIYERIGRYEVKYNRLLIYRGDTLHGAEAPDALPLTDDPATGRFSINTFIWLGD
ncbi:MAG TPA: DUF6445 family protein [Caulobacteraceae bacterium]|jgi:hypothetical protein